MAARRARGVVVALAAVVLLSMIALAPNAALARFRLVGAGGCGNLSEILPQLQDGDLLLPMTDFSASESVVISRTLVIQGGWAPATSDCTANGTNEYDTQAQLLAGGFAYQPNVRSDVGVGGGQGPTLPLELLQGQTMAVRQLNLGFNSNAVSGPAINGALGDGARLRLENIVFDGNFSGNSGVGGAVYITLDGGSHLTIVDSVFQNNEAFHGGGLELLVDGGSTVVIERNSFISNTAQGGSGGAIRITMRHGSVVLRDNTFTNNRAQGGSGGAIRIERSAAATGPTTVVLERNSFSGNSATTGGNVSLSDVEQLTERVSLPAINVGTPGTLRVEITDVSISDAGYRVDFTTSGYTPSLAGRHVHFFFNTVPAAQAGIPGSGPWVMYGGQSPYTGYNLTARPKGATQLCALVANADHSVIQRTGNCVTLP